jgi:hypothetical protein
LRGISHDRPIAVRTHNDGYQRFTHITQPF